MKATFYVTLYLRSGSASDTVYNLPAASTWLAVKKPQPPGFCAATGSMEAPQIAGKEL